AVPEADQGADARIEIHAPALRKPAPVCRVRRPPLRKSLESLRDGGKRDAKPLGRLDDGHAPQDVTRITALIAARPPARDQPLALVEMKGGDGDAAATCHLADAQLPLKSAHPALPDSTTLSSV